MFFRIVEKHDPLMSEEDNGPENAFPPDHPFNECFYAMPQFLNNMQDKLMAKAPTWTRVKLDGLSVAELKALFEKMREAFPPEDTHVSLPIFWDWRDPAPAFSSPLFDDKIISANKKQKHMSEHFY